MWQEKKKTCNFVAIFLWRKTFRAFFASKCSFLSHLCMKKNYYLIALGRYFSTPVPFGLLISVPVMMYGYYADDLFFWVGLVATVALVGLNHLLMHSLTTTYGYYATRQQVRYVHSIVAGKCEAFSDEECSKMMEMIVAQAGNSHIAIEDYINYINQQLKEKSERGNAEATYWLALYHRHLGEATNHNSVARDLMAKAADMGSERAKKMQGRAKKWV